MCIWELWLTCNHDCERSSVQMHINTKVKATRYLRDNSDQEERTLAILVCVCVGACEVRFESRIANLLKVLVLQCSEKLEKAGTVDFKKHPARKVGTRSRQCGPKVPGRFALPGARNPRICSISRFGKISPAVFPGLSRSFPREPPNRPQKQPQPSRVF